MRNVKHSEAFKHYVRLPLYLIPLFALVVVLLFQYDHYRMGNFAILFLLSYSVIVITLYIYNQRSINRSLVNFAVGYATVQKSILENLDLPYALVTSDASFLWMNKAFEEMTGKTNKYNKSVTSLIPEITKEKISSCAVGEAVTFSIVYEEMYYQVTIHAYEAEIMQKGDMIGFKEGSNLVYAIVFYDKTREHTLELEQKEREMVAILVYVDNYEEIVDAVDSVRLSVIRAVIERKVYKYFQDKKALVRRTDRDKYVVVTDRQGLSKMEKDNFAILEQIKTTNVSKDVEATLSIGIGTSAEDYVQNLEFAKAAIDMALGRGGSQAVIKEGDEISYYGVYG